VDPARDVDGSEPVELDGRAVSATTGKVVYAVNKPLGVISTASDPGGRRTVVELVPAEVRLSPVGRLDINTSGLMLLTNDGELANLLTHPRHEVPKTYLARLGGGSLGARELRALSEGVELEDGPTLPAKVRKVGPSTIEIELREGRNRQVRRMCKSVGRPVLALQRIAIGPLALGRLNEGGHRRLTRNEIDGLRAAATRS
jgi:23S rRNA pseudouridine2605 synthase